MRIKTRTIVIQVILFFNLLCAIRVNAQSATTYSNGWIDFNQKKYVKVIVNKKGIHKIPFASLPTDFPVNSPENLQLFHRGKEIAIISTDNQEVTFYGVPNDGSSDSLLFRPMSSRLNPYSSIYSTQGVYFLTNGAAKGKRATKQAFQNLGDTFAYHTQLDVKANTVEYSHSTSIYIEPDFLNSFLKTGQVKQVTGLKVTPCILLLIR
jgi:hypothetical protein